MPSIKKGQKFPSLADFKKALLEWAVEKNFTPSILDSDARRVRAGCRSSPGCPFRIRANLVEERGYCKVTTCEDVHTCTSTSGNQDIPRPAASKMKFLLDAVPKLLVVNRDTTTISIIEAVEQRYGQRIALRQAQKVKQQLVPRPRGPCNYCGAPDHTSGSCPQNRCSTSSIDAASPGNAFHDSSEDMQLVVGAEDQELPRCESCSQLGHNLLNCPSSDAIGPSEQSLPTAVRPAHVVSRQEQSNTQTARERTPFEGGNQSLEQTRTSPTRHLSQSQTGMQSASAVSFVGRSQARPTNLGTNTLPEQEVSHVRTASEKTSMLSRHPPNVHSQLSSVSQNGYVPRSRLWKDIPDPPTSSAREIRLEAARLMQQAATCMQEAARLNGEVAKLNTEAARLNAEAARLTASAAAD
ncbi:hypothetical protein MMC20_002980 [Loxospora ochrophaea]|nr:hypothetical protein [Loxospora ochrophaea]